jgi:hypothetical protein
MHIFVVELSDVICYFNFKVHILRLRAIKFMYIRNVGGVIKHSK